MAGEAEIAKLRGLYAAWSARDFDAMIAHVHPAVEFRTSGAYPGIDPEYRGHDGIRRFWDALYEPWESLEIVVERYVVGAGGRVAALWRFEGVSREGVPVRRDGGHVAEFEDGLLRRFRAYADWEGPLRELEAGGAAPAPPPSPADLVGVWLLEEWTSASADDVRHPAGRDARGVLIYLEGGRMSVHIAAADGHTGAMAYTGRWELRGDEVVHHVEIDARPERPGTAVTRRAELSGDELVLTKPPEEGRVEAVRWRRAEPGA